MRCDGAEDLALVAEVEAHHLERNLRLVAVGKHFEGWSKAGVRDHVRSQLTAVVRLRPALLRFAVHRQHQHRMVRGEIGGWVVAAIPVCAYSHHHIRIRTQRTLQLVERDATDARRSGKIRVIGGGEADLGQAKQILVGDELPSADLEVGRACRRMQEWTMRLRGKQQTYRRQGERQPLVSLAHTNK